ncbi:MAG: hypothetical protein ACYC1C_17490 [Chloroflexota bacterium]
MSLLAMALPIIPGKREEWNHFIDEITTTRRQEFVQSRRRLGLRERTFLQETPKGDLVIVTVEGENPTRLLEWFGSGDPFARWMSEAAANVHGADLSQPLPADLLPEESLDTGNEPDGDDLLVVVLPILPGKMEQWRRFQAQLSGPRRAEFVASRERMGLRQRVYRQSTPIGDTSIVTLLGAKPGAINQWFASGDPLSRYVAEQVRETSGVDMLQPLPASGTARLVADSERPAVSRAA